MKKRGRALGILFATTLLLVGNVTASAASSAGWQVNYLKGAPSQSANPVCYSKIAYSSDGFYVNCTYLTGSYDRQVRVTSSDAQGIRGGDKYIRNTGKTNTLYMVGSSTSSITYKFIATASDSCNAKGTIQNK